MIGRLYGKVISKTPPQMIVDVNGVGYEVSASMQTFYQLADSTAAVVIHTHLIVREDAQILYGFAETKERELFRSLIKVNGVGPKLALTILSSIQPQQFIRCVHQGDTASLIKLPGVGKRTAERLIIEMRDRVDDLTFSQGIPMTEASANIIPSATDHIQDAISALVSLGYKPQDASKVIARLPQEEQTSEMLIRAALQQLAR